MLVSLDTSTEKPSAKAEGEFTTMEEFTKWFDEIDGRFVQYS